MALFQKKPQFSKSAPLYTFGLQKSFLVVGLGNIGKEYDLTRHNIGFMCADKLVKSLDLPDFILKKDLKCHISIGTTGEKRIIVIKPTTLMNLSGQSVLAVMNFYKIPTKDIIIIHDELDIDFGQIRTRLGGGSAGHNGIKSIIQAVGQDFKRIRIGIKNNYLEKIDSADFVLQKFSKDEQEKLSDLQKEVTALVTEVIYGDSIIRDTRSFLS
ncbi:MAG: aminoacyl-tRNA hydrolase [Candidatus Saccharimonadales bacterium]